MKKTIIFLTLILTITVSFSQVLDLKRYNLYLDEGNQLVDSLNFFDAYEKYRKAEHWAGNDQIRKQTASDKMDYCIAKIKRQQIVSDSLLLVAKEMQLKVETAMFDKAVKEQNKEWKGYANMLDSENKLNDEGKKILEKIDSLDLSNNALLRLPKEVAECPNLKHINLLGNPDIDWASSENTLSKLNKNVGIYVTVNDLSDIDSTYWKLITGIEIFKNELQEIPENILRQKQLTYLDLSAELYKDNNFSELPKELFKLTNLKYLNLTFCQIDTLPLEIGNLNNLTRLYINNNQLSSLPPEIGNLINLIELVLYSNQLSTLPLEIGILNNLSVLNLGGNRLSSLPPEIGNLSNLTELDLRWNELSSLPPEIGDLYNLTMLDLWNNELTTLPLEIGNLTNLTTFSLHSNQLSSLPSEIGNLKNLTILIVYKNPIISLPNELEDFLQNNESFIADMPLENYFNSDLITAGNYFEIGTQLLNCKNYENALIFFLRTIEKDKNYIDAYSYAGVCYRLLGNNEKAIEYLEKRLEFDENDIWTLSQLSATYSAMQNNQKSYEITKELINAEPENYSHFFNLSWYALFVNKPEEAITSAQKSLELAPDETGAYTNLALAYVLNNQYENAEPIYLEWKDKQYDDDRIWKEVFLQDIADLEAVGIKHKDFEKVRKLLE
ncbi:MAG: leucine-rich repeat domain-containing protein [Bacteroidales bacterium]|nr:leucine-rich repeat domain-containing protein [Bacteroidales bacterium]